MIDLKTLKAGDVVLIEARVAGIDEQGSFHFYGIEGGNTLDIWLTKKQADYAIKEIIPKPFNWDDVKHGMAFIINGSRKIRYYIGRGVGEENDVRVFAIQNSGGFEAWGIDCGHTLTRAPEHDMEA